MKKFIGSFVALAFAVTASAQTSTADLEAQIQALLAQIASLSGTTTTTVVTTSESGSCNFTQTLTLGSTGAEVVELQSFLEMKGTLTIPAGVSKGYFGGLTQSALASYQAMVGISPAVGVFGPITRAHVNGLCATAPVVVVPGTGTTTGGFPTTGGDEASLEKFSMDSEDDAEEGEMQLIATVEFDVEDGDFMMERVDITFDNVDVGGDADDEPWDAFETIYLAIDGDVFAEEDVDDEDDWNRDNNPFVFRVSGLDQVTDEGDTFEFEIWLTAASNVDDAANADWKIYIDNEGVRGIDTAGITQYIGDDDESVSFGIDEEGGDEEIKIKSSNDDPDSQLLKVDEDNEEEYEVFVFDLEAEDNDIEIDELVIDVILGNIDYATAVNDVVLEMGSDQVDDFTVVYYTDATFVTTSVTSTAFARLTFDVDGDFEVDADDREEVTVLVEFKKSDQDNDGTADGIFDTATVKTIQVGVRSVDGEGVDDVSASSSVTGNTHTLTLTEAQITNISWAVTESQNSANGTIDFMFTVDNSESDEDFDVDSASIIDTATAAFTDAGGFATDSGEGTLSRVSGDSVSSAGTVFTVDEGDTVGFRVRYTAALAGTYEASITEVAGVEIADDKELSPSLIL